ncbi:MAG TPA: branched-chain amino acid ABC transporter ATP-binding protein [Spirochaetia bacterium]|nr:MAG: branched-chain amino acid ABC transporter ATP-binding protein [Spirochaetes bacterium GWB1_36_13]HCL56733.1 branched-chain amino acid ABC transporter ATP-binding protein [Spirochaetia bacterium]
MKLQTLKIENLKVAYGGAQILHGVSLEVNEKEAVAVLGPNGAGKTTLMRAITGLAPITGGDVFYQEESVKKMKPYQFVGKGIMHCLENRRLFSEFTVKDNLMMGAYALNNKSEVEKNLETCFEIFPILKERLSQISQTMSGGEQQMIAIARGLMSSPKVLLLDEPSVGLAQIVKEKIFEGLDKIKKQGVTILLVEQDAVMAMGIADRIYIMESGKVVLSGSRSEMKDNPYVKNIYLGIA